jgi:hypothetical protein
MFKKTETYCAADARIITGKPFNYSLISIGHRLEEWSIALVRNLSVTGGFHNSRYFLLFMPDDGWRLRCRVVRRDGYLIGVT